MALIDYLCLGGVELVNNSRTLAYMANGVKPHSMTVHQQCACPDLDKILGDEPYRRPDLDAATPPEWTDPGVPESYDFAGLLVTEIEGIDAAPRTRATTARIGDGVILGRPRLGPRTITVTGLLVGSSCCGIDYGMRWLASALAGSVQCGGAGCGGDDLVYLTCCPEICEDSPGFTSYADCALPYWRTLREVGAIEAPSITRYVGAACACCQSCPAAEVTFTLQAGRPHALREPVTVTAPGETWGPGDPETDCPVWSNDPDCVNTVGACAPAAASCLDSALEALGCLPTVPPALPVPSNPCVCEPLSRRRHCVAIPSSVVTPTWSDVVPDVEVYAGSTPLKGVRIRFYPNPLERSIDELDECAFCAEINISVVPASATIRIDGTRRRTSVMCPGSAEVPAGAAVTGAAGGPWTWPVLDCGVPYLMCVEADAATIAPDATITARVVSREV